MERLSEEDATKIERCLLAGLAVAETARTELQRIEDEQHLLGTEHVKGSDADSPARTALYVFDPATELQTTKDVVATYLLNVRDGLMDATGMFFDLEDIG